ncbi:sensor histidine kinase [Zavarzinia compransoris]|uniref:sensor histidine kinase n=1 Tax=Zavarzinia compransoris TaxID=1264899 RepID=UPI0010D5D3B0|nr:HAMP domain-containing sensor histidine kinase [Zavarzinia compransoris]TDP48964.1 signal transduction histidine kinase [Zavarzinia compransoris]
MLARLKDAVKRRWPPLRLRAILTAVLLFVALLPALGAIFLRVYENTLVRQTEAELIAQAAVIEAALLNALGVPPPAPADAPAYAPRPLTIDLNTMEILAERPPAVAAGAADPALGAAARAVAPVVERAVLTTLAAVRVLDARGVVVLGRDDLGLSYGTVAEVRAALAGAASTVLRRRGDYEPRYALEMLSRAAAIRVHYTLPVVSGGEVRAVLLLSRSPRGLFRGLYDDLGKIALGVVAGLAVIVAVAGVLSRTITRPIDALGRATATIAAGGHVLPETPPTAAVEIRALFHDFRIMAARIEQRSNYLRDFARAVSHEFKTPLAGIRGALELLEDHGAAMTEAERRHFIANALADAGRLNRLVGRLLSLARADMAVAAAPGPVDPAVPCRRAADALAGEGFAVELPAPPWPAAAIAEDVLEAVFSILFENSRQAGARRVTLDVRAAGGMVTITVADDGAGIAPGDRDRLFEPFFTTRRASGGTGLGLAIARALLRNGRADLDLVSAPAGTCFRLSLPAA